MSVHIFGGGTFFHVRNHMALCAPAFGKTARYINTFYDDAFLHLTKMADPNSILDTNEDVEYKLDKLIEDPYCKIIYFNVALCDYEGSILDGTLEDCITPSGKYAPRLKTREGLQHMRLTPAAKLIGKIRKTRKDIFVVGFKTTCNATPDEQYLAALNMLKENSINLVLANDTGNRRNMIVAPEETRYCVTTDRNKALTTLVEMTNSRSRNTFTRSTVIDGDLVPWNSNEIPDNLRQVVNHCIKRGAYKPFRGSTAGHFAVKVNEHEVLTSVRKTNYNDLDKSGLVRIEYDGLDKVIAHGAKPSVGGQSQRIVFDEHPDLDCIVHFHCPTKENVRDSLSHVDQAPSECGSHQCGSRTSKGLKSFGNLEAVMLDNHGPNIVFSKDTPAQEVIDFIEANFDLEAKTGGLVS
ncbi:MAG: hypothetical protein M0R77_18405 [Gammaproteobacteria bacterium]|nr:hypothetical protein [Gammaproteobacteria bacterium]